MRVKIRFRHRFLTHVRGGLASIKRIVLTGIYSGDRSNQPKTELFPAFSVLPDLALSSITGPNGAELAADGSGHPFVNLLNSPKSTHFTYHAPIFVVLGYRGSLLPINLKTLSTDICIIVAAA